MPVERLTSEVLPRGIVIRMDAVVDDARRAKMRGILLADSTNHLLQRKLPTSVLYPLFRLFIAFDQGNPDDKGNLIGWLSLKGN